MSVDVVAMVLAGGRGSRLGVISWKRAKPAVPFGGIYRIIDFTLSNLMYSGIRHVGVMTQYRQNSLMEHLGDGMPWGWNAREARLKVLHPVAGEQSLEWYEGTADAVYRNLDFITKYDPKVVLVVSGDHIYRMDYRPMIRQHLSTGADITIAGMRVPWEDTARFGVMVTQNGRVRRFLEKSPLRVSNLASMGIYCFSTRVLTQELPGIIAHGGLDFGKDVIPVVVDKGLVMVHEFDGYWRDVGTVASYFRTSMDALKPGSGLDLASWRIRTNMDMRGLYLVPPAWLGRHAVVKNSMISRGCIIKGTVENSIISPRVIVQSGAVIKDSVVMNDTVIGPGARVSGCIIDKEVVVGEGVQMGGGPDPEHVTVAGKAVVIPPGMVIGKGVVIEPNAGPSEFQNDSGIDDHGVVKGPA